MAKIQEHSLAFAEKFDFKRMERTNGKDTGTKRGNGQKIESKIGKTKWPKFKNEA